MYYYDNYYRAVSRRFAKLEAHVVGLARSVAQLSSELYGQQLLRDDVQQLRRDVTILQQRQQQQQQHAAGGGGGARQHADDWERYRGWVPAVTNPRRVKKLTRYDKGHTQVYLLLTKVIILPQIFVRLNLNSKIFVIVVSLARSLHSCIFFFADLDTR